VGKTIILHMYSLFFNYFHSHGFDLPAFASLLSLCFCTGRFYVEMGIDNLVVHSFRALDFLFAQFSDSEPYKIGESANYIRQNHCTYISPLNEAL
jgi:hypothetical protein